MKIIGCLQSGFASKKPYQNGEICLGISLTEQSINPKKVLVFKRQRTGYSQISFSFIFLENDTLQFLIFPFHLFSFAVGIIIKFSFDYWGFNLSRVHFKD